MREPEATVFTKEGPGAESILQFWCVYIPVRLQAGIQEVSMITIIHKELGYQMLGLAYKVHNTLGPGLMERAYEEAMCIELRRFGIPFEQQKVYTVYYEGEKIGNYTADLVVDNKVILELKSVWEIHPTMQAQLINYLKISKLSVGYHINFHHKKTEWIRCLNQR
jgi:GxxExxY protein